jgi:RHS Repeat
MSMTVDGVTTNYNDNELNQYASITGVAAPTYDGNGNLKTYNGWSYTYDAMNRLTAAVKGATSASFYYDGLNRQVARWINGKITFNVWDGSNLFGEFVPDPSGAPGDLFHTQPIHGAGGDLLFKAETGFTPAYYYPDALGSTSHVANSAGNLLESYTYDHACCTPIRLHAGQALRSAGISISSKVTVAGVAETGHDVAAIVQLGINCGSDDRNFGMSAMELFDSRPAADQTNKLDPLCASRF